MLDEDELFAVYQAMHATVHVIAIDEETTSLVFAMQEEALELLEDAIKKLDRCDPAGGYHSTPHKSCIMR